MTTQEQESKQAEIRFNKGLEAFNDGRLDVASEAFGDAEIRFPYLRHQGIYAYSREFLLRMVKWKPTALECAEQLEQLRAIEHGARIQVLVTKHASVGVDTPADAKAAAALLA